MLTNVKVLLVDDNPMVLDMLKTALSSFATVETATEGTDALLKISERPPDLVVTDYSMPGMDGRQLLEQIKGRAASARLPVILVASKNDISEKLKMLQDSVEDFVEKPFFIKEATARIKRVVDKIALEKMTREAPGESVLRGNLQQMNIMDLFQSLELGHKTCELIVTHKGDRCQVYFSDGQVNHARLGALAGDEAVFKSLTWSEGNFQIDFSKSSSEQTITRSTQGLLMEGLRILDEANRDAEENVLDT